MPRALETLEHVVQQLERGQLGAIEAIETLLAEEVTIRESRRVRAALQMARLATIKTRGRPGCRSVRFSPLADIIDSLAKAAPSPAIFSSSGPTPATSEAR